MQVSFNLVDFWLVAPALAMFLVSLVPLAIKVARGNKEPNQLATLVYGFTGCVAALGFALPTFGGSRLALDGALVFDGISSFATVLILAVTAVALTFARESSSINRNQFSENVFLIMNCAVGMLTMAWSNDLIVMFVGLELFSLCLYMLIAMSLEEKLSKEAAFKYFILGSFASALMLYGISFIYGTVGSTYLPDLLTNAQHLLATNRMFALGFVLLLTGLFFKVSIFPFHAWAPDVYQGSPTPLTVFMATGVKAAALSFLLRIVASQAFTVERFWPFVDVLQWLTVLTILVGNVGAFRQRSLKRMLAYSSVAHSGYVMIGLIAAGIGGSSNLGASSVLFYILSYATMTAGAFGVIHLLERRADSDLTFDDLRGLAIKRPYIALAFSVLLLSLTGIPPTVGFFGKFFLFSAAIKQGLNWMAFWGVIGSIVSVYYYLRPIVAMYMQEPLDEQLDSNITSRTKPLSFAVVASLSALTLVFGVTSDTFYQIVLNGVSKVL